MSALGGKADIADPRALATTSATELGWASASSNALRRFDLAINQSAADV